MRLRVEALAIAIALLLGVRALAGQPHPERAAETPSDGEIARALETVKADPNLTLEQTIKTLQWKEPGRQRDPRTPAWLMWVEGFFRWVAQSTRVMIWMAAVLLAALLVVYIGRIVRERAAAAAGAALVAPTHVRNLDIRPESLPADLGRAARALWDRGEHRAALALLYRGMLSRLVHVHKVPIRDSSTEGDCLTLAASSLTPPRSQYVGRLVNIWQRFVYAGQDIHAAAVYVLCDEFALNLDADESHDRAPGGAA